MLNIMYKGDGFSVKPLGKSPFHCQMSGPPVQFWLLKSALTWICASCPWSNAALKGIFLHFTRGSKLWLIRSPKSYNKHFILSCFAFILKNVPNCINKASLPPNLYRPLSMIFSYLMDRAILSISCDIYIIQTGDQKFASGDYISPVGCQKATWGFF